MLAYAVNKGATDLPFVIPSGEARKNASVQ
jgi:hypothetical protein